MFDLCIYICNAKLYLQRNLSLRYFRDYVQYKWENYIYIYIYIILREKLILSIFTHIYAYLYHIGGWGARTPWTPLLQDLPQTTILSSDL